MSPRAAGYPADPWMIRETVFDPASLVRNETIFALANGSLGIRGSFEEGVPPGVKGTYLNGFYDETPIVYGEIAFAYAKNRQVMLNVADATGITLSIDGEMLDLSTGTVLAYERRLDLRLGILSRELRWKSPKGREISLTARRLVSFSRPAVAAIEWAVEVANGNAPLLMESSIIGAVTNQSSSEDPRVGAHFPHPPLSTLRCNADQTRGILIQRTRTTERVLACAMDHEMESPPSSPVSVTAACTTDRATTSFRLAAGSGVHVTLSKFFAYCAEPGAGAEELAAQAVAEVAAAQKAGFAALAAEQLEAVTRFWHTSDVQIDGDDSLQQGLRYNLFSLFQSAGRDGRTSIAAKGLTGQGYEGHYFWDTEIYVLPFFAYTQPDIARALIRFRCSILDKARDRAREMSQRGALYPWRTIGGEETSAYYPAGTAQYHINADIVHALRVYREATGDATILDEGGAEMLFETARLWVSLGWYSPRKGGAFCINEVTGPNEYTALANNNLYTNMMARENLEYAVAVAAEMRARAPHELKRIAEAISLTDEELADWSRAAASMYIPVDAGLGIHAQDDSFLDREPWNLAHTAPDRFPLLLHFHPLVIYRRQVLKQPDVVLAQVLLGHRFSHAEKKRNFDYYDPLTTGDSSLSPCIQCVAAAEIGSTDLAYAYFSRTARMDLDDVNGNVGDGVHTAAMAGTWISLVRGFAGMRDHEGRLSFNPRLPPRWDRLRFRLLIRGRLLEIDLTHSAAVYRLVTGPSLEIVHRGSPVMLSSGTAISRDLTRKLQAVIFDLDGVLTDTAELHYQGWKAMADEIHLPFNRAVNEELRGIGRRESLDIILRHAGVALPDAECARLAERKNNIYRQLIATITPRDTLPGVNELLAGLRAAGIKIGLASASHNATEIVQRLAIGSLIDAIVSPAAVAKGKPDPEMFFRVAEQLGTPFENCVGVEDARAGIRAIRAAGMFSVGIGESLADEADWCIPDTRGLTYDELSKRFTQGPRLGDPGANVPSSLS